MSKKLWENTIIAHSQGISMMDISPIPYYDDGSSFEDVFRICMDAYGLEEARYLNVLANIKQLSLNLMPFAEQHEHLAYKYYECGFCNEIISEKDIDPENKNHCPVYWGTLLWHGEFLKLGEDCSKLKFGIAN